MADILTPQDPFILQELARQRDANLSQEVPNMNNGQDLNTQTNAPEQRTLGLGNSATAQQSGIGLSSTDSTMGQGRKFSILERIFNGLDAMGGGTPLYLQQQQLDVHRQDLAQEHQLRRDALDQQLKAQEENKRQNQWEDVGKILNNDKLSPPQQMTMLKEMGKQNPQASIASQQVNEKMIAQFRLHKDKLPFTPEQYGQKLTSGEITWHDVAAHIGQAEEETKQTAKEDAQRTSVQRLLDKFAKNPHSLNDTQLQIIDTHNKSNQERGLKIEKLQQELKSGSTDLAFKENAPKEVYSGPSGPGGDITTGVYDPRTQNVRELSGLPLHRTQDVSTNEQAHARDRIDAVADLKGTINQYRKVLRPESVGMIGDLRALVYGAGQQVNAFSQLLQRHAAGTMADLMATGSDVSLSEFNDPKLSQSQLLSNLLAAKYARVTNPVGVITDKDYIIAKKGLGLDGLLTGATDITEKLKALEIAADRVEAIARTRLRDQNERPGVTAPSTKPKYDTIEEYKKARGIK